MTAVQSSGRSRHRPESAPPYVCEDQERTRQFYEGTLGLLLTAFWVEDEVILGERHVFSHAFYELPGGGALAFFNFADPEQQARYKAQPQPLFVHLALEVDRERQRDLRPARERGARRLGGRPRVHILGLRDRPRRASDRTVRRSAGHRGDPDTAACHGARDAGPMGGAGLRRRFATTHQARRVSPDGGVAAYRDRGRLPTALLRILHARRRQRRRPIRSAVRSRRTILEAGPGPALRKEIGDALRARPRPLSCDISA